MNFNWFYKFTPTQFGWKTSAYSAAITSYKPLKNVLELFSYEKVKNGAESLTLISRLTNFNIMFSTCKTNILWDRGSGNCLEEKEFNTVIQKLLRHVSKLFNVLEMARDAPLLYQIL